jgi:hypothetical protein
MPKRLASCLTPNLTSARSLAAGDECFRGMKVLDPEGGARVQRLQLRVASFGATIQHKRHETVTCNALPALLLHLPWPPVVTKKVSSKVTSEVTSSA